MNELTPFEEECEAVLLLIREVWFGSPKKLRRYEITAIRAQIREALRHLENKRFGCTSGLHAGGCTCRDGVPGKSTRGKTPPW